MIIDERGCQRRRFVKLTLPFSRTRIIAHTFSLRSGLQGRRCDRGCLCGHPGGRQCRTKLRNGFEVLPNGSGCRGCAAFSRFLDEVLVKHFCVLR